MLGGISQTAQYKGYRFDIGGHRFFTKYEPVEKLWHEILGPSSSRCRASRASTTAGSTSTIRSRLERVERPRSVGSGAHPLQLRAGQAAADPNEENFEQWVSNRFGQRLYEIFFKTYTEKVWGIPCTRDPRRVAAQRIQNLSLGQGDLEAASIQKRSTKIKSHDQRVQYPRRGPGRWGDVHAELRAIAAKC
jgi:protoporphyrinogen oxidase